MTDKVTPNEGRSTMDIETGPLHWSVTDEGLRFYQNGVLRLHIPMLPAVMQHLAIDLLQASRP